jgi:hypothetical protein
LPNRSPLVTKVLQAIRLTRSYLQLYPVQRPVLLQAMEVAAAEREARPGIEASQTSSANPFAERLWRVQER